MFLTSILYKSPMVTCVLAEVRSPPPAWWGEERPRDRQDGSAERGGRQDAASARSPDRTQGSPREVIFLAS